MKDETAQFFRLRGFEVLDVLVNFVDFRDRLFWRQFLRLTCAAGGEFNDTILQTAWTHCDAPWQTDQIHCGEFAARAFVAVVIEGVETQRGEGFVNRVAGRISLGVALFQVDDAAVEGCHALGPDYAILIMAGLDYGADQA